MLEFQQVTFQYRNGSPIFLNFNWRVEKGDAWAVLGPSGCGKSTLLALAAGLLFPTQGQVLVEGQPLTRPRPHTGLIIQDYGLLPWATVRENAALGLQVRNFYGADGIHAPKDYVPRTDVTPWLERLGLLEVANQFPSQISGGQRQRTAIARTLALEPDLLLMDEPFSSLDAPTREGLQMLVMELWADQRLTLVLVTHAIEEAAMVGKHILVLGNPPNSQAMVVDNPGAGEPNYRTTPEYQAICQFLREVLNRP